MGATRIEPAFTFTLSTGYKPEGIRPGWPPRSRTEQYRLIRAVPSTGWAVASGRRRCRSPRSGDRHKLSKPVAAPAAHLPWFSEESGGLEPQRFYVHPRSGRCPQALAGSLSTVLLSRPVRTGRRWRKTGDSNASASAPARFPAGDRHLTVSSSEEGGRLERHRVTGASLSGRARTPVRFTFRAGSEWGQASQLVRADQDGRDPPPQSVRREGVEPSRPKAPVPGTGAAASYATSALTSATTGAENE
jgi:hypothetical protein